MKNCSMCRTKIQNVIFVGSKGEEQIYSCFRCLLLTVRPLDFDGEVVYYPLDGIRSINSKDLITIYTIDGLELGQIYLQSLTEGFLSFLVEEIASMSDLKPDDLVMILEPFDVDIKIPVPSNTSISS